MSKEIRDDAQLIELVRQINFLLTGRYVSVNTTPIQKAIDRYAAERGEQARIDELEMLKTHIGTYKAKYIGGSRKDYDLDTRITELKQELEQHE